MNGKDETWNLCAATVLRFCNAMVGNLGQKMGRFDFALLCGFGADRAQRRN